MDNNIKDIIKATSTLSQEQIEEYKRKEKIIGYKIAKQLDQKRDSLSKFQQKILDSFMKENNIPRGGGEE